MASLDVSQLKIDHIGIAVRSLEEGAKFYQALGFKDMKTEVVEKDQVKVGFLKFANQVNVELLEPTAETSPVAKFIEKRGTGIHHICYRVANIQAYLDQLKGQGIQLIDEKARQGAHNCLIAFVHPKSAGGVLVELSEKQKE